ncbi:MAG: hypothetical protein ACI8UR_002442 [Natronomonas sp.]|uniref:VanZ family protein n=1 Tax=Natronomonas sp. TaxID=2184060 RepID=UPI003988FBAB
MTRSLPVAPSPLRYAGVLACLVVILAASVAEPGDGVPPTLFGVETSVYLHAIAYAGLTGAIGYARLAADRRGLLVAGSLAVCYGVFIELLQGTLSYRSLSTLDVLVNASGTVVGASLWWAVAPLFGAERAVDAQTTPL